MAYTDDESSLTEVQKRNLKLFINDAFELLKASNKEEAIESINQGTANRSANLRVEPAPPSDGYQENVILIKSKKIPNRNEDVDAVYDVQFEYENLPDFIDI